MRNPLRKRILRDIRGNVGRYMAIFLLLLLIISFGSGFLIAGNSLLTAYNNSFEKYNVEWGHFVNGKKAGKEELSKLEKEAGVSFYDMSYSNRDLKNGSTLRIYAERGKVNQTDLMSGRMPENDKEIAIDRMYADNNKLEVGDRISDGDYTWKITGLVSLSDYSSLFEDNGDSMFDALQFGVAIVTKDCFRDISSDEKSWCYSWKYDKEPKDDAEEADMAEDLLSDLNEEFTLDDFVPRYQNQAITFTGTDFGGDKVMMEAIIYIMLIILAFVFAVTINSTIQKESAVIGTLLASGYSRGELVRHYMAAPIVITLMAAIPGNVLGYTVLKNLVANLYYQSYSLPPYVTIWNGEAFIKTTFIPVLIMAAITFLSLNRSLKLSPIKFLRRDLKKNKQGRAIPLNSRIPFFSRFRIRVILQNMSNYLTLFIGILFANLMLFFGLVMPLTMNHYLDQITDNMFVKYQYMLKVPVSLMSDDDSLSMIVDAMGFKLNTETDNPDAEKFSSAALDTTEGREEEIAIYGIEKDSKYIDMSGVKGETAVSSAYAEKAGLSVGDTVKLKDKYENKYYKFRIGGIVSYDGSMCIFTDIDSLNEKMDYGDSYFSGYFSDTKITDIDQKYIGTIIDEKSLTKTSRQLLRSLGKMMYLFDGFAVIIFIVLMYLLGKVVIERNATSISMTKILGYNRRETMRLYVLPSAIVAILEMLISLPIESIGIKAIWNYYVAEEMNGWMPCYIGNSVYIKAFILGVVCYGLVALLEFRHIKKIPMDEALKNVE